MIRPYSHSLSDDERCTRPRPSGPPRPARDPVLNFPRWLVDEGVLDRHALQLLHARGGGRGSAGDRAGPARGAAGSRIGASNLYSAKRGPDVRTRFATEPHFEGPPETMVDAINRTLAEEMRRDPRIVVFGEDVADCSREART